MLFVLMYHRIGHHGKHSNTLQTFRDHLTYLKHYPTLLPGEKCSFFKPSICLTFDDAYYDFYHFVYPLLKEFKMKAILGVPARYILDHTSRTASERLSVPYTLAMQDGVFDTQAPFCTWKEIKEMSESGYVHIASHAYMHCNLTFKFVDLEREIVLSKKIIEDQLNQSIDSFIYPFGRTNRKVHDFVSKHYRYTFRIGSGLNFCWHNKPLFRIIADNNTLENLFRPSKRIYYFLKSALSAFR